MQISFPIYSPVSIIHHPLLDAQGIALSLKRDDMIHPFISGNKWRKLKYHLQEAQLKQKTHLVSFGGVWSNHLLALACACASFGFKSSAFVRGEDIQTDSMALCRLFGMNLIFTDRESYRNKAALFEQRFAADPDAMFVNEGGAGKLGAIGCAELLDELTEMYDHIFVAAGTGTTAAGIISGISERDLKSQCHVVPVLKGADFLKAEINELCPLKPSYQFHSDYHFGGYAKTSPELIGFIKDFAEQTGILLDPVYTGKMLYALFEQIAQGRFERGSKILAIHTGGLFGLLGMKDKF